MRDHNGQQLACAISRMSRGGAQRPSRSRLGSTGLYHPPLAAEALTIARTIRHALLINENAAWVWILVKSARNCVRMTPLYIQRAWRMIV